MILMVFSFCPEILILLSFSSFLAFAIHPPTICFDIFIIHPAALYFEWQIRNLAYIHLIQI